MTRTPLIVNDSEMFADAENVMLKSDVTSLLVVSQDGVLSSVLKLQDASRLN